MSESTDMNQLLQWLEGKLSPEEMNRIESVVQSDESFQMKLEWLQGFLQVANQSLLVDPPPQISKMLKRDLKQKLRSESRAAWFQNFLGTLVSDSWQRPALAGVRSQGGGSVSRQLIYTAESADIALHIKIAAQEETLEVSGQVFPTQVEPFNSFTAQLTQADIEQGVTFTDEIGKFAFSNIPAGIYSLTIQGDHSEITIIDIDLTRGLDTSQQV